MLNFNLFVKLGIKVLSFIFVAFVLFFCVSGCSKDKNKVTGGGFQPVIIYTDYGSEHNHYDKIRMSAHIGAIQYDMNCTVLPQNGNSCIKLTYNSAGMNSEIDLTASTDYGVREASKLTFWAKGENGGEVIEVCGNEFQLTGEWVKYTKTPVYVPLVSNWNEYSLFSCEFSEPSGTSVTVYIDDIIYE